MVNEVDPNAPAGNGDDGKSAWEKAGFESEAALLESAKASADLKNQIEKAEATLKKEREAKSKTDADYLRQSNEIGDLRKELKELEGKKPPEQKPPAEDKKESDEELLESLADDEEVKLLEVLNDPKNVELKKAIAVGGDKAKAEFVRNYRINVPVEETVLTLKKRKDNTVQLSSIARAVKDLFKQHNDEEKNNLAAVPSGGALPDKLAVAKKQMVVGGVDVDFFKKDK